jgi:hypothetical protein
MNCGRLWTEIEPVDPTPTVLEFTAEDDAEDDDQPVRPRLRVVPPK